MSLTQLHNIQPFMGLTPQIATNAYVHATATVIGDVVIGADSSIWPSAVVRGDVNSIRIGIGSNIQDLTTLHVNHRSSADPLGAILLIGNYVTVGHNVVLHGCTIQDTCLIGMGSIVMDKVLMQPQVLLAAGSLVPAGKVLESGYLYVGRPAKKVRALTTAEIQHLTDSAHNYIALKNQYLLNIK